jgi:sulfur carrier protein
MSERASGPPRYHAPFAGPAPIAVPPALIEAPPALVEAPPGPLRHAPRPPVTVLLQPEEKTLELTKAKTVRAVLTALGLRECTALVIRGGELLTPDRAVAPGESLIVRKVTSSG